MSTQNISHPTHLIVGPQEQTLAHAEQIVIQHFCPQKGVACFCHQCRKIKQRQHSHLVVISPVKSYTVDDLEIIFEKTAFALDSNERFFFILENAHLLTSATANRLLKILEEPSPGYFFFLTTPTLESVLPTIISRCLVTQLSPSLHTTITHPLLEHFIIEGKYDPLAFEADIKKYQPTEQESVDLVFVLLTVFSNRLKTASDDNVRDRLQDIINFLLTRLQKPPQAGSVEFFWKHLFLQFPRL